jgi:hypothetical protein
MNVFDEISDRLAALSRRKAMWGYIADGATLVEVFALDDIIELLCGVEEAYNLSLGKEKTPVSFDPTWVKSVAEKCESGEQFSVSGSSEFIEMVREVSGSYGYSMHEWGICEHQARLSPPIAVKGSDL